jgi:hypothetical protein
MSGRVKDVMIINNQLKRKQHARMLALYYVKKKAKLLIAEPQPTFGCITCGQLQEQIIYPFVGSVDAKTAP